MKQLRILMIAMMAFLLSCEEDKDPPTVKFTFEMEEYTVTFTSIVTGGETYAWDFGDGNKSTEANPVHTYTTHGDYNVKLSATGDGGTTDYSFKVTVVPSVKVALTGGVNASNGKTWILSKTVSTQDGIGAISAGLPVTTPLADNVLNMLGLQAEYDDEYTFFYDGKYKHDCKNGGALTGLVYLATSGQVQMVTNPTTADYGLCAASFTPKDNATWSFSTDQLTLNDCINEADGSMSNVTVTKKCEGYLSFSAGEFIGLQDYTSKVLVKSISDTEMNVVLFLHGLATKPNSPTNAVHITFKPKQ